MRNIQIIQIPPRKTLCRCRVSYRSHRKTDNILGLADHTDPTPENISVCTNYRYSDPTLANVCEKRARSRMVHPGKHERVCKSELFTAYRREHMAYNMHVRQKYLDRIDSQDPQRNLLAARCRDILFGRRNTRAAATDICHAYAYALLQLHVMYACGVGQCVYGS